PDPAAMASVLARICREAGAASDLPDLPEGAESVVRHAADGTRFAVVLNHNDEPVTVPIPPGGVDPRDGTDVVPPYRLDARGVLVVRYPA
ncbi:hypothetical protein E1264_24450, partial [Actinomadura sp. KC216]|uniref:Beta-galactosidase C-terminal domain n=1 Tax=Actinomadura sp. KC216 TaxID=2530370 RepID=UPI0010ECCDF3